MVFKKIIFQNSLMANETPSRPPPLHGKCHLKFPFWFFAPFPYSDIRSSSCWLLPCRACQVIVNRWKQATDGNRWISYRKGLLQQLSLGFRWGTTFGDGEWGYQWIINTSSFDFFSSLLYISFSLLFFFFPNFLAFNFLCYPFLVSIRQYQMWPISFFWCCFLMAVLEH